MSGHSNRTHSTNNVAISKMGFSTSGCCHAANGGGFGDPCTIRGCICSTAGVHLHRIAFNCAFHGLLNTNGGLATTVVNHGLFFFRGSTPVSPSMSTNANGKVRNMSVFTLPASHDFNLGLGLGFWYLGL